MRVLIVDDSPTLRLLIRSILESDPEVEVVGEAKNGLEAIQLAARLEPDLVTMDIRMPRMNGFEAIQEIMSTSPRPIVVLTSTMSDRELGISFKAVEAGALSVLGKPRGLPGTDREARQLVDQLKAMAEVKVVRRRPKHQGRPRPAALARSAGGDIHLVAIGASTGGPPALQEIFSNLPADFAAPIVVTQHISPGFIGGLARWLDETTPLTVKVATNGERLAAGTAYLAADNRHLMVAKPGVCWLKDSPPLDGHRPSVTMMLRSVTAAYGAEAAGVILTGMGRDGAEGLKELRQAGGRTIAQDEASSIVFGMPQAAIQHKAAQEVLPLGRISLRLLELAALGKEARP